MYICYIMKFKLDRIEYLCMLIYTKIKKIQMNCIIKKNNICSIKVQKKILERRNRFQKDPFFDL